MSGRDGDDWVRALMPAIARLADPTNQSEVARLWASVLPVTDDEVASLPYGPGPLGELSLLDHVNEVNELVEDMIGVATITHGLTVDAEVARCAAILHDLDKPLLWQRQADGETAYLPGRSGGDHGRVAAGMIRDSDLAGEVADIVLAHSAFSPRVELRRSPEAVVVHMADLVSANLTHLRGGFVPPCGRGVLVIS
jgi:putative nucleotidyltransferase with HDIG domain